MPINYPIKFEPILKERIWGGGKLHSLLDKPKKNYPVGESWEISTIPGNVSVVANGKLKGQSLQDLIDVYKSDLLGVEVYEKYGKNFPLLVKFIDATDDLSVQLHPNDTLALQRHQSYGKEEMWYIMQTEKDSKLFFGFNKKLSIDTYKKNLFNGTLEDILHKESVHEGGVYHIPSGRVHAIGGGILLAEIQQSSDVTYRLFDWNRRTANGQGRELHTELALDAIDFQTPENFKTTYKTEDNTYNPIFLGKHFSMKILLLSDKKQIKTTSKDSFTIYMCVEGKASFCTDSHEVAIKKGESILIPASFPKYTIVPYGSLKLLHIKAK